MGISWRRRLLHTCHRIPDRTQDISQGDCRRVCWRSVLFCDTGGIPETSATPFPEKQSVPMIERPSNAEKAEMGLAASASHQTWAPARRWAISLSLPFRHLSTQLQGLCPPFFKPQRYDVNVCVAFDRRRGSQRPSVHIPPLPRSRPDVPGTATGMQGPEPINWSHRH